jgi:hypothetical protein
MVVTPDTDWFYAVVVLACKSWWVMILMRASKATTLNNTLITQ